MKELKVHEKKLKKQIEKYYDRRESRWGYKYILSGNKHYGFYSDNRRTSLKKAVMAMSDKVAEELDLLVGAKVLDAGCGEGPVSIHLAQKYGYEVTGIDLLKTNIDIANKAKKKHKLNNVNFKTGDFSSTGLPDNYFDGVVILEALVHSPDYRKTINELCRVLKPVGVFVTHNYILPAKMTPTEEHIFNVVYEGSGMTTLKDFRIDKMRSIWSSAGLTRVTRYNGIKEITPMMKRLYQLAFLPFLITKILGKEENYTNMYAGYWMYKLRHLICYEMIKGYKPKQ